jgi:hypothetical protein
VANIFQPAKVPNIAIFWYIDYFLVLDPEWDGADQKLWVQDQLLPPSSGFYLLLSRSPFMLLIDLQKFDFNEHLTYWFGNLSSIPHYLYPLPSLSLNPLFSSSQIQSQPFPLLYVEGIKYTLYILAEFNKGLCLSIACIFCHTQCDIRSLEKWTTTQVSQDSELPTWLKTNRLHVILWMDVGLTVNSRRLRPGVHRRFRMTQWTDKHEK